MSKFSTKKYTRPHLKSNIRRLPLSAFTNVEVFAKTLSPRSGRKSAQFSALTKHVNVNKVFKKAKTRASVRNILLESLSD